MPETTPNSGYSIPRYLRPVTSRLPIRVASIRAARGGRAYARRGARSARSDRPRLHPSVRGHCLHSETGWARLWIAAATCSAVMITVGLVFTEGISGRIDASMSRRPLTPLK